MSFSGLSSSVRNTFNAIKTAITNPIDTAKGLLKSAIDTIKGLFPFNLGKICNLKLPHINVSAGSPPWGIGGKGTKPSFSVDWCAKGGIFQQPTLFTTPNGLAGVGEAGAEAVLPLSLLWKHMEEIGDNIVSGVAASNQSYSDAMYHAIVAAFGELSFSISDREFARILRGHGAI
jgi:phage-related protein